MEGSRSRKRGKGVKSGLRGGKCSTQRGPYFSDLGEGPCQARGERGPKSSGGKGGKKGKGARHRIPQKQTQLTLRGRTTIEWRGEKKGLPRNRGTSIFTKRKALRKKTEPEKGKETDPLGLGKKTQPSLAREKGGGKLFQEGAR